MGRGRKGVINQSKIKSNNACERHREQDKPVFFLGLKKIDLNQQILFHLMALWSL